MKDAIDDVYLYAKAILVFGVCGALRCIEITNLKVNDVEDIGNKFIVSVKDTKTNIDRQFIVGPLFYDVIKEYSDLRPLDHTLNRFFLQYHNGKCTRQFIGKNKIGEIPKIIAT